ncbi:hypothetical protein LCGC14_1430460 [marine sediment metagenome]|uniref:Transglutaminase-like domain-containing protein n=1 Tax=marine sediment metagenome TaxID=412755 RepID=A0A0F9JP34_9ZZZZ
MSELREEILGAGVNKKKVIAVVLVAVLLTSFFSYSVFFISALFGSQRPSPNKEYKETPYEEVETILPPLPLDILLELLSFFADNPELLADFLDVLDLEDFADVMEEMLDGDIDNFDIGDFSQALLPILGAAGALLLGEQDIFRVYNLSLDTLDDIDLLDNMQDFLWKYESFDEYNEHEWVSTAATEVIDFTLYSEYFSEYSTLDLLKIKRAISPTVGLNKMVLGSLFPYPYILEDSLSASNLVPGSPILNKDEFNNSLIDLDFSTEDSVNLTYELFQTNLPSEQDINNSVVVVTNPSAEYLSLESRFTQLPPTIDDYKNTHPNFKSHYDALDLIINDDDNVFIKANKIKSYLQTNFIFSWDAVMNDPPGDTEDIVEWFCEQGEGLYAEFATAFNVFARAFNIPSRFVDGYRTKAQNLLTGNYEVDKITDSQEGYHAVLIKYKHLYNWAEIFVPTNITGNGYWVQFDIEPESAGTGSFTLNLNSNITGGFRGQDANFTAVLSSPESSVADRTIIFVDLTSGTTVGQAQTDQNGQASVIVNITNSQVVGPHIIRASFQSLANDITPFMVYGDIVVNLASVNPTIVNRSISDRTSIQGYVNDPVANQRVENATVEFVLLNKGTNNRITNAFNITYTETNSTGYFDTVVNVNSSVIVGSYEVRVDFNGSWGGLPLALGYMSNSSNRIELNITEEIPPIPYMLLFSINGTPTDYNYAALNVNNLWVVKRGQQLNLSITLINEGTMNPVSGENVYFYDYTNGNSPIGSDMTDINGNASISYYIGPNNKSGPTLVYAQFNSYSNYSYYIVNESISVNINNYSSPLQVDVSGSQELNFNIICNLTDSNGNPIGYSDLDLKMNRSSTDFTGYLTPAPANPVSDPSGSSVFNFYRGVNSSTPVNNYTLRLEFNGSFDFSSYPYSATFTNLPDFYNLTEITRELRVYDYNDVQIYFFVNGSATREVYDDSNKPKRFSPGDDVNFTAYVNISSKAPISGENLTIWDDYSNTMLDNYTFPGVYNNHSFIINTTGFHAGIHRIRIQIENYPTWNTTFIIINETVTIKVNPTLPKRIRNSENLTVSGYVVNETTGLRGLLVSLQLFNSTGGNYSQYLIIDSRFYTTENNGYFEFVINLISITCPQGNYSLRIDFNGSISLAGTPRIGPIQNYMINTNSSLIALNITAGTNITLDGYHTKLGLNPTMWYNTDILYVYGNLTWDNETTPITDMFINVTIRELDGTVIAFNDTVQTDSITGDFNISLVVDSNWPAFRSDTEIWIEFNSINNGLLYVEDFILKINFI